MFFLISGRLYTRSLRLSLESAVEVAMAALWGLSVSRVRTKMVSPQADVRSEMEEYGDGKNGNK